uniref:Uncharacterized protein n=1 Tax=Ombrophytum subterraneum TaxID=50155 RepID=A0A6M8PVB0_9MAGN|nr:hypothetical protein [Ombrophytum subterraneum]
MPPRPSHGSHFTLICQLPSVFLQGQTTLILLSVSTPLTLLIWKSILLSSLMLIGRVKSLCSKPRTQLHALDSTFCTGLIRIIGSQVSGPYWETNEWDMAASQVLRVLSSSFLFLLRTHLLRLVRSFDFFVDNPSFPSTLSWVGPTVGSHIVLR